MKKLITVMLCLLACGCQKADNKEEPAKEEEYSCRILNTYDYSRPVPYSDAADDSYYDDALFVGDSRMGSIALYGTHDNAQVEYVTSLNLMRIENMAADDREDGSTLMDILRDTDKHNVYMLFGINEIRNPNFKAFGEKLESIVGELLQKDPYMNIYIILSYHPDNISGLPEPQLSEHLTDLNTTLQDIAVRNHIFYLNPDEALDDEQGTVIDDYVWDGLHFNVPGARAFEEFLGTHTVRRDDYVKEICE